mmetsp:Transcript_90980/g.161939  ORF Transcript_90980/g.161939 Transcript_90980/m.161939 type:complete len:83 (+) Transcript_90980:56-304(+)
MNGVACPQNRRQKTSSLTPFFPAAQGKQLSTICWAALWFKDWAMATMAVFSLTGKPLVAKAIPSLEDKMMLEVSYHASQRVC